MSKQTAETCSGIKEWFVCILGHRDIFPNMHIIANDELELSYNLILSATMFQHLIYEIDDKNQQKIKWGIQSDCCL